MNLTIPKISVVQNFKGHEARKLDAIYVHQNKHFGSDALMKQLQAIASLYRIDVIRDKYYSTPWIQDCFCFTPDGKVLADNHFYGQEYADIHGLEYKYIDHKESQFIQKFVAGGNLLFVTDKDGKKVAITARNLEGLSEVEGYEEEFGVDKVISLPHVDYHADLFVTPIGDNKILIANDDLMLKQLDEMLDKALDYMHKHPNDEDIEQIELFTTCLIESLYDFREVVGKYYYKGADEKAAKQLENEGFEVIRIPSRIYNFNDWNDNSYYEKISHQLNYSNAITFKNRKNEPVLIIGKSDFPRKCGLTPEISKKLGIDFEDAFKKSIYPHVKPENIHFITGDKKMPISNILENFKGGLHCMCVELPEYNLPIKVDLV